MSGFCRSGPKSFRSGPRSFRSGPICALLVYIIIKYRNRTHALIFDPTFLSANLVVSCGLNVFFLDGPPVVLQ